MKIVESPLPGGCTALFNLSFSSSELLVGAAVSGG